MISSVCISKNGMMIWNYTDKAKLTMKSFNEKQLQSYLSKISDEALYAYNVYQIEGEGRSLFSKIEGDQNTIMGLPINKIKDYLKKIMNKYLVIGNPIEHSLSPLLHNYWFKKNGILDSIYEKQKVDKGDLKRIIEQVKNGEIKGVNVTVPFKREIFDYLDSSSHEVQLTKSVNTILKEGDKVVGYNTDQGGFEIIYKKKIGNQKVKKF